MTLDFDKALIPAWDETKLAKTPFRKLMDLWADAKAREAEAAAAAAEYKSQMSALMLKNKLDGVRVEGYLAQWCKGGTRRTLSPELLLSAGCKPAILEKGYKVVEAADYFTIRSPREKKAEE